MESIKKLHNEILEKIVSLAKNTKDVETNKKYHGSTHIFYDLKVPAKRKIAKEFKKEYPNLSYIEYINLIDILIKAESYEEKTIACEIMCLYPELQQKVNPKNLDIWLNYLEGWAEIDSLCQSTFKAKNILNDFNFWSKYLNKFSKSPSISKRRASLVLLTHAVTEVTDEKLREIAFRIIDDLKKEKNILITKAISWLLRELVKNYKAEVVSYLEKNKDTLPKLAIRETYNKIKTGKK